MGEVIIKKLDSDKTAKNHNPNEKLRESQTSRMKEREHVDVSRKVGKAENVEKVMNDKKKDAKTSEIKINKVEKTNAEVEKSTKVLVMTHDAEKTDRNVSSAKKPGEDRANRVKNEQKTSNAMKAAQKPAMRVQVVEQMKLERGNVPKAKQLGAGKTAQNKRALDPELALLASRSAAAERVKTNTINGVRSGRSMSGMVGGRPGVARGGTASGATMKSTQAKPADVEQLSKGKSALIGVGVALAVAVIGFLFIGIFGNNKNKCTVQFESNGGSAVEDTEIVCGRTVQQPDDPVKEGFSFEGWIYEGDEFDFDSAIYKDAMLVASWKAHEGTDVVKVKFNTDGGSSIKDVELAKGAKLPIPNTPTKVGYVFSDWYLGDKPYEFSKPVTENITLKAIWVKRETQTNNNGNNNSQKPAVKVTSMSVNNVEINEGANVTVNVGIVPMAAEYKLGVSVANGEVASCTVSGKTVTCTGKAVGSTTVRVKDDNSGVITEFTVAVVSDVPDIEPEPEPEPVASLTVGNMEMDENTSATVNVGIAPVAAEYALSVTVKDGSVASCSVSGATVSCTGVGSGVTEVQVKDDKSGVTADFTVTVKEVKVDPEPEPEPKPEPEPEPTPEE